MIFLETPLKGVYVIEIEPLFDERGFFGRAFCAEEFEKRGLCSQFIQCSISFNEKTGTLRGLHYQKAPHEEIKLVRCTSGSIYDVIVDIRPDSPTFKKWFGIELSAQNRQSLYIPKGFAHGFITRTSHCEVFYQMSTYFCAELSQGFLWNEPEFAIHWPEKPTIISAKDQTYLPFQSSFLAQTFTLAD